MTNLLNVRTDIFNLGAVIAKIYRIDSKGIPHFDFKTTITAFKPEMSKSNNIILFCDNEYNIISGQIGTYSPDEGINVLMF